MTIALIIFLLLCFFSREAYNIIVFVGFPVFINWFGVLPKNGEKLHYNFFEICFRFLCLSCNNVQLERSLFLNNRITLFTMLYTMNVNNFKEDSDDGKLVIAYRCQTWRKIIDNTKQKESKTAQVAKKDLKWKRQQEKAHFLFSLTLLLSLDSSFSYFSIQTKKHFFSSNSQLQLHYSFFSFKKLWDNCSENVLVAFSLNFLLSSCFLFVDLNILCLKKCSRITYAKQKRKFSKIYSDFS